MIRYRLNLLGVEVSLDSDNPHTPAPIVATGDPDMVPIALEWLANQYGAYGHSIGSSTTPLDLAAALTKNTRYLPELLEGAELVTDFSLNLPDGAVS